MKYIVVWGKLFTKSIFYNIRFPLGKISEDAFVIHKIYFQAKIIIDMNEKLYFYRKNDNSITNSKFSIKRYDAIDALTERLLFFEGLNNEDLIRMTNSSINITLAKFSIIAHKEKVYHLVPKKYRKNFISSLMLLNKLDVDTYEAFMINYYPTLVRTQAYLRKLLQLMNMSKNNKQ